MNIDVYQGNNSANMSIDERTKLLHTPQKPGSNSMYKLQFDISDGSNVYRHLSMDNRYALSLLWFYVISAIFIQRVWLESTGRDFPGIYSSSPSHQQIACMRLLMKKWRSLSAWNGEIAMVFLASQLSKIPVLVLVLNVKAQSSFRIPQGFVTLP